MAVSKIALLLATGTLPAYRSAHRLATDILKGYIDNGQFPVPTPRVIFFQNQTLTSKKNSTWVFFEREILTSLCTCLYIAVMRANKRTGLNNNTIYDGEGAKFCLLPSSLGHMA